MAINFPLTTGQATDGSFTHTASNITWAWDGTTWNAQGVSGVYTLPIASNSVLGGVKIGSNLVINPTTGVLDAQTGASVNCFSNIAVSGQNTVTADSNSDTLTLAAGTGISIGTNSTSDTITITATGGGGSGLQTRTTAQGSTSSIADGVAADVDITAAKTFALLKVETSAAAWVTIYTDGTSRTNDASRTEVEDPTPGSGVLAEVITAGAATQIMTPGTFCWNNDGTPADTTYLKVVNKSGSNQAITVTLTYVQLEG